MRDARGMTTTTTTTEGRRYEIRAKDDASRMALEMFAKNAGFDPREVDQETLRHCVERAKRIGNERFGKKDYEGAVEAYTTAIAACDWDKTLYSNRSAAALGLGRVEQALRDGAECVRVDETWAKGYYRLGCALMAAFEHGQAVAVLTRGLELSPGSVDIKERLDVAKERYEEERSRVAADVKAARRDFALQLRDARAEDRRTEMENQWKQSLSGPDWEVEDYEWRPTFIPQMCLRKLDPSRFEMDPGRLNLINYATALAELSAPKKVLDILDDDVRIAAYKEAIELTVEDAESDEIASALVLGEGTGILALLAARAGLRQVVAIEQNKFLYRMAKQVIKSNAANVPKGVIQLLAQKLNACSLAGAEDAIAKADGKSPETLANPCDLVITDLFDHALLGKGILRAIDRIGKQKLASPNARVIPSHVSIKAQLIEFRLEAVSGFDLSALNAYRWHPQASKQDLHSEPHVVLSDPFDVSNIDMQARLVAALNGNTTTQRFEQDDITYVTATKDGVWNAIAFWYEMELCDGVELKSYDINGDKSSAANSWGIAVQYLDEIPVKCGEQVELKIQRDADRVYFSSTPPSTRPRHANIPSWHYDMLNDSARNDAYESAIKKTISRRKGLKLKNEVLDVGAGSGLLSMFSMRAGADKVYAAEMSLHMCDAGEETVCLNGYGTSIIFLNRDARRIFTKESDGLIKHGLKPDGSYPEMERKADLLVYEVFDSGLIGEGAFHIVGMAKHRLLNDDASIIPRAATVYAQPIQIRTSDVAGFDFAQANRWRWRPSYEGINLEDCRDKWKPLAPFKEVFDFDFNNYVENLKPAQSSLEFDIEEDGVFNAIAFWFKLELDDEIELTTSPHVGAQKGKTWQQAVQYIEELKVKKGDSMPLIAAHDTYGITFEIDDVKLKGRASRRTGVPAYDPTWHVAQENLAELNSTIAKAVIQNPMQYRESAETAIAIGSRPADFGLNAEDGADYCLRFMS